MELIPIILCWMLVMLEGCKVVMLEGLFEFF